MLSNGTIWVEEAVLMNLEIAEKNKDKHNGNWETSAVDWRHTAHVVCEQICPVPGKDFKLKHKLSFINFGLLFHII